MIGWSEHNGHPALPDEPKSMITPDRDPAWTGRAMAELFARATAENLSPVLWRLGFFALRDLVRARDENFVTRPWKRMETCWGCGIVVDTLGESVSLIVQELGPDGKPIFHSFNATGA